MNELYVLCIVMTELEKSLDLRLDWDLTIRQECSDDCIKIITNLEVWLEAVTYFSQAFWAFSVFQASLPLIHLQLVLALIFYFPLKICYPLFYEMKVQKLLVLDTGWLFIDNTIKSEKSFTAIKFMVNNQYVTLNTTSISSKYS